MLDLADWVTRLQSQTDLKKVGLAADLEAARRDLKQMPAAFILLGRETVQRNEELDEVGQLVDVEVIVAIAIDNAGAKTGARNIDQLKTIREQIDARLLGWQPSTAEDKVEYDGGRLLGFSNQILWWADSYATQYLKQTPGA